MTASRGVARRSTNVPPGRRSCGKADLWAYLDGELPAGGARAIARHIAVCAECGARARRLRAMLAACRAAGCRALPADVRARARRRTRALLASRPKKS